MAGDPAAQPAAPAPAKPQRVERHLFLTHARSMVLFGLTIITAVIAFLLYPTTGPAHASSNISEIDAYLAVPTSASDTTENPRISVDMKPDGHGGTMLQFASYVGSPDLDKVTIAVPASTWGPKSTDCGSDQPKGVSCSTDKNEKYLDDPNPSPSDWVHIPATSGDGWGAKVNSEYVSIVIPTVDVLQEQKDGTTPDANAIAFMGYHVALQDVYTWVNGTQPQNLTGGDPQFPIRTQASWSPVAADGTAQAVLDQDQFRTFIAGAAVGVAAAAFAAAIAELIGTTATETRTRRRLAANTPTESS